MIKESQPTRRMRPRGRVGSLVNLQKLAVAIRLKRGSTGIRVAAAEADIDFAALSRVEREESTPDLDTYILLCRWLNVNFEYFVLSKKAS